MLVHLSSVISENRDASFSMPVVESALHELSYMLADQSGWDAGLSGEERGREYGIHEAASEHLRYHGEDMPLMMTRAIYWRPVTATPAKHITARPHHSVEFDLDDANIVSLHALLDVDLPSKAVLIGMDTLKDAINGTAVPMVFSPAVLASHDMKEIRCWKSKDVGEDYRIMPAMDLPHEQQAGLPQLLRNSVAASSAGLVLNDGHDAATRSVLQKLQDKGWIDGPPFKFTAIGCSRVVAGRWIHQMRKVFRESAAVGLHSSVFEVIDFLQRQGWHYAHVSAKDPP